MKGELVLCNLFQPPHANVRLAVVRSLAPLPPQLRRQWEFNDTTKALGPEPELYQKTVKWKQRNEWPSRYGKFAYQYVSYLFENDLAKEGLTEIDRLLDQGKTVALGCFCHNAQHCHRLIIAHQFSMTHTIKILDYVRNKRGAC
jgi:uncharacterized protein YeaO (DUF488 family)